MRKSFPLHIHLWVLFGSLILIVGSLTCGVNFVMTKSALEAATSNAAHRTTRETLELVEDLMTPAELAVRVISHSSLIDAQSVTERLARVALVRDALDASPALQALYVGYSDGGFFYVRPLRDKADRAIFGAPADAAYVVRNVERSGDVAHGRMFFLDSKLGVIESTDANHFAGTFDPRQRPWYVAAMDEHGLIRTEPYMFYSDRQAGASLAIPAGNGQAVVGGDIRLDRLGQMMARRDPIPRAVLALLDGNGQVVAIDRQLPATAARDVEKAALLPMPIEYGIPILSLLSTDVGSLDASANRERVLSAGGEEWYTTINRLTPRGGGPLFLVSAIPQDELLSTARKHALLGILTTGLVILLALPLSWVVARRISRPLRELANGVKAIRRFEFAHPVKIESRIGEVTALADATEQMRQTIQRFLIIGHAVSSESRLDQLLPILLRKMQNAAGGNAGVLYTLDGDSVKTTVAFDRSSADIAATLPDLTLEDTIPAVRSAIATLEAQTDIVKVEDACLSHLIPLTLGARCHVAAIPLVTRRRDCHGVVLVLRDSPIEPSQLSFVSTLCNLFAGAIEVRKLAESQHELFDAFIRLLAGVIDAKSPHTGGHCERVPELAKMLAQAACKTGEGPYQEFRMSDTQWEALNVAAWLHDCGKITTPEYILGKGTKLETLYNRIHEIRTRFEVLKRDAQIAHYQAVANGEPEESSRKRLESELQILDEEFAFVAACNQGRDSMDDAQRAQLRRIGMRRWSRTLDDRLGLSSEELARSECRPAVPLPASESLLADKPEHLMPRPPSDAERDDNPWGFRLNPPTHLYNRGELHNLLVERGTLCEEERFKIEEHIVQTQIMLSRLPFPKHLREVPEIAGNHHERMDGQGYPRGLSRNDLSPLARILAIADVFEALTSIDRPYKVGNTLSEAVQIMATAVKEQHLDAELFELFLSSGVYREYAERFMRPEQIDDVDIAQYLSTTASFSDSVPGGAYDLTSQT